MSSLGFATCRVRSLQDRAEEGRGSKKARSRSVPITVPSAPHPEALVKVRVLVTQSCPTLQSHGRPPGSSVRRILQARILEWVTIPFSRGIFPTQGSNVGLPLCRQILYYVSHQGSPRALGWPPKMERRWGGGTAQRAPRDILKATGKYKSPSTTVTPTCVTFRVCKKGRWKAQRTCPGQQMWPGLEHTVLPGCLV